MHTHLIANGRNHILKRVSLAIVIIALQIYQL